MGGSVAAVPLSEATSINRVYAFMAGQSLVIGADAVVMEASTPERQCRA